MMQFHTSGLMLATAMLMSSCCEIQNKKEGMNNLVEINPMLAREINGFRSLVYAYEAIHGSYPGPTLTEAIHQIANEPLLQPQSQRQTELMRRVGPVLNTVVQYEVTSSGEDFILRVKLPSEGEGEGG